jgi:recombinational DNA repair protein RecR
MPTAERKIDEFPKLAHAIDEFVAHVKDCSACVFVDGYWKCCQKGKTRENQIYENEGE